MRQDPGQRAFLPVRLAERDGKARARVEARSIVAMRRPRDIESVRQRLLTDCRRPGFAKVARYSVPRGGKKIEGPSVRFAEAALRSMGNLDVSTEAIYDDAARRIVRVSVIDLESNAGISIDVSIDKTIERRETKAGDQVLATRQNSTGNTVYVVAAREDDLLVKQGALVSKALRNGVLRLLPGDILDECMEMVQATAADRGAKDPDAARRAVIDAFQKFGVTAAMLGDYLGHAADTMTPDERADLIALGEALRDKEATFADALREKRAERGEVGSESRAAAVISSLEKAKNKAPDPDRVHLDAINAASDVEAAQAARDYGIEQGGTRGVLEAAAKNRIEQLAK